MNRPFLLALGVLLATGPLLGCGDSVAEGAVDPEARQAPTVRVRVRTAPVERTSLDASDRVAGTVRAFHGATVKAETSGRVLRRAVERGEDVAAGATLIELDASRPELELRQAEATLRSRRTDLEHAKREQERGESLVAQDAISEQRRDDLQHGLDTARNAYALAVVARDTAKRHLADATITAPVAGSVDDLLVEVGDFVAAGTPVARVIDLSRARVFGGVTAEEAARLTPGMRATASFASLGGFSQDALLKSVARAADPTDGTYRIELWIDEPNPRVRDGMIATLEFAADGMAAIQVPRAALIRESGRSEVFVVERTPNSAEGEVTRRTVRTGRIGRTHVEVLSGIEPGEEVVIDGHFALRDGAPVTISGVSAAPPGPAPLPTASAPPTAR